jgi:uncharacterized protein YggE
MKKILIVAGIIAMLSLTLLFQQTFVNAQVAGNAQYNTPETYQSQEIANPVIEDPSSVTIAVSGLLNARADGYVATFNIIQIGETIEDADQLMRDRINKFLQALKAFQLDTSSVKIDMVSFVPKFDYQVDEKVFSKTYNEVPVDSRSRKISRYIIEILPCSTGWYPRQRVKKFTTS